MPGFFRGLSSGYSDLSRAAALSGCGKYRYWLHRQWARGGDGREVCFVMLNPSTADALVDDPTVRRCAGFTRSWGYSSLAVLNLFALRATDPGELLDAEDPVGPGWNDHLRTAVEADLVVCAWGASVPFARDREVLDMLRGVDLYCLGLTKQGYPRHPLYVKGDTKPQLWRKGSG